MSVYGASAIRDRRAWLFGLTGPQFFMVLAAGFPTWMAIALGQWLALLGLVPMWGVVALLTCLPIRGHSAFQWIGVLVRHLAGAAFGWSRFQSTAAAGDTSLLIHNIPVSVPWVSPGVWTEPAWVSPVCRTEKISVWLMKRQRL